MGGGPKGVKIGWEAAGGGAKDGKGEKDRKPRGKIHAEVVCQKPVPLFHLCLLHKRHAGKCNWLKHK